jgi:SapC
MNVGGSILSLQVAMTDFPASAKSPASPAATGLPLFYEQPAGLDPKRHSAAGLLPTVDYSFAAGTNSIALTAHEFAIAHASYPIVFGDRDSKIALAIVGLAGDRNLFVQADGSWRRGAYVPAYVRRYPFIFHEDADAERFVLCVDEAAGSYTTDLSATAAERFFDGDKPTPVTERALAFCSQYQSQAVETKGFVEALWDRNLLVANQADVTMADGRRIALGGFFVIDEARFNVVDAATFLDWRTRGWLALIYAHLMSMQRWPALVDLAAEVAAGAH